MVMTHKSVKDQKAKPIFTKEKNAARKFMSHDEAVADNARIKADRDKLDAYAAKLKAERHAADGISDPAPEMPTDMPLADKEKRIQELKVEMESFKGPGSKAKKENHQAQINMLIHSY